MPRGSDDETLDGAVAIVTGAAGGIGGEVVAQLRAAGASVVAEDIDPAVERLADDGTAALCADAADADAARQAVDLALTRFGRLDVVVNNAGRFLLKAIVETTDEEWDGLMTTNVRSVFVHCRAALPHLIERGGGAIVNVSRSPASSGSRPGRLLRDQGRDRADHAAARDRARRRRGARQRDRAGRGRHRVRRQRAGRRAGPRTARADIGASHPLGRMASAREIAASRSSWPRPRRAS